MDIFLQRRRTNATAYIEKMLRKLEEVEELFHTAEYKDPVIVASDLYFRDGIRKIDFIMIYKKTSRKGSKTKVNTFIRNLENEGFQFEAEDSEIYPDLMFIKIFVPRNRLIMCAIALNYDPLFMRLPEPPLLETEMLNLNFMYTNLTRLEMFSEVSQRASKSSLGARPQDLTSGERIMITYEVLKRVRYGEERHEFGVHSLLTHNYLHDAYPLHDGMSKWPEKGPINDRQLLKKYWASFSMILKFQPLDLIHKYYGADLAFYFAYIGFYNRMLIPVALLGLFSVIYGALSFDGERNYISGGICNSEDIFCPTCRSPSLCNFKRIKTDCALSKLSYLIDNEMSFLFATIMSLWATLFQEMWKRKMAVLRYKWDLGNIESDPTPRPEFAFKMKGAKFHGGPNTFANIPFTQPHIKLVKIVISVTCCILMASMILGAVLGTLMLRLSIIYVSNRWSGTKGDFAFDNINNIAQLLGNTITFLLILFFDSRFKILAKKLTDFENPRTEMEYDKSYIYKIFLFSMVNNYSFMIYTAFFRGAFFTYPGDVDKAENHVVGILNYDVSPHGNMLPLALQFFLFMTGKSLARISWEYAHPMFSNMFKGKWATRHKPKGAKIRRWEIGYCKFRKEDRFLTILEYKSLMVQFGYLVLFPTALPLAPLIALTLNLIELRVDAYKITKFGRRPVPIRVPGPGYGSWYTVLVLLSQIGIFTNSLLLAFTSNLVTYIEKYYIFGDKDYLRFLYSKFDVKDYKANSAFAKGYQNITTCLYIGQRFPPDHPRRYQKTLDHYVTMSTKLASVIIFNFVVFGFNRLLAFAIPDVPQDIKDRIAFKERRTYKRKESVITKDLHERRKTNVRADLEKNIQVKEPQAEHPHHM